MLIELRVSNFALIEDLSFNFSPGLNVLSGETGAGKSIVIGAINLLLGERATVEQIRQGEKNAHVEGVVSCAGESREKIEALLEQAGIENSEELIVGREVQSSGRSVARVNGRAVPVSFLKEMGKYLVDLHGQHQHQSLLRPEEHLELLDAFGGEELNASRRRVEELYRERHELQQQLAALGSSSAERERRLDVYEYQLNEINNAELQPGEDEELAAREKVLANAEKLFNLASEAYADLYSGSNEERVEAVVDRLNRARHLLGEAAGIDQNLSPLAELVESAAAQLEEASHELRDYQSRFEFDPAELQMIQERQNLVRDLKRKYGATIEDILDFAARTEAEMERLRNSEETASRLEQEIKELENQIIEESSHLHRLRRETAGNLEALLEECLQELALPNARFAVRFFEKSSLSARGTDQVEFMFSANRGEEVKPLTKIISGGEVSRVMLALKTILARQDLVPTLVFDEVDAGIGGVTVQAVAEKLAHLSGHHQVLCVTHSPQIAAMADYHFSLFKETVDERTLTRAALLDDGQRREELARMLDGAGIDQVSLKHVDSVLERARRFKEQSAG